MKDETQAAIGRRVRVVYQDVADHPVLPRFTLTERAARGAGVANAVTARVTPRER